MIASRSIQTAGWGLYLTCSWTWCIGLFLPIVLLHRYGWPGLLLFAVPNLIGCVAFGYVVATPDRSRRMVERYRGAMKVFAAVTISFHALFLAMIARWYMPSLDTTWSIALPGGVVLIGLALIALPTRFWPLLAAGIWALSIAAAVTLLPQDLGAEGTRPWQEVIWLLPITSFGFLLCPYLDPTFHRAMQESPSKHAFAVFGVAFAIMIGLTCLYRDVIIVGVGSVVAIHMITQSAFTVGAHFREAGGRWAFRIAAVILAGAAVAIAHREYADSFTAVDDYLRFFVFYGLIFPAMVAMFMWTGRRLTPMRVALFAVAILFSLPLLEAGYIRDAAWLTALPVVVFLTWAFATRGV